jgi:hypothetical protein
MRKNYSFLNPTCEVKSCPRFGTRMEKVYKYSQTLKGGPSDLTIHVFGCRPRKRRSVGRGPLPGRHYAYRTANGSSASCLGPGQYKGTDIVTGEPFETVLTRKRGSRLMPGGQSCPQCGGQGRLQGPQLSERLGESFWRLRCQRGHTNYYWKRNGELKSLPPEALKKLHSRTVYSTRCDCPTCPSFDVAMSPQKKRHYQEGGGAIYILHCYCRGGHKKHLVLPKGYLATQVAWGIYEWTDKAGQKHRTLPRRRRADGTSPTWRPIGWDEWPPENRMIGILLIENPDLPNRQLGHMCDDVSRLKCPFPGHSWEEAFTRPGSGANWIAKLRKAVKRPAPQSRRL